MNPTMNRRNYLKSSLALGSSLLLPAGVIALAGCSGTAREHGIAAFDGKIMGTGYSVLTTGQHDMQADMQADAQAGVQPGEGLGQRIHAVLQDVDTHMSTWRNDSELSRFNASEGGDWQPMTSRTLDVIAHALQTSRASEGAFDATVEPLVSLWGFGAQATGSGTGSTSSRPTREAISRTLGQIGFDAIDVDLAAGAVRKHTTTAQLDLSGIAKGHAVDRLTELLDLEGHENYLVEVGGELRSKGRKPDGSGWRVAIERPEVGRRGVYKAVDLDNRAIATSGNYRNFFDHNGTRYSHSIDPRTGQPVNHALASVSVIADTTMQADALSTALMIMGPEQGMAFAEQHQVTAHMITREGKALVEHHSPLFATLAG